MSIGAISNNTPLSFTEQLHQQMVDFSQFITQTIPENFGETWEKFKGKINGQTKQLEAELNQISNLTEWKEKKEVLVKFFASPIFSVFRNQLQDIVKKCSNEELNDLMQTLVIKGIELGNDQIMNRCLDLLTLQKMESLIKDCKGAITIAKDIAIIAEQIEKYRLEAVENQFKTHVPWLLQIVRGVVNTILAATFVLEIGREPEGYYEASYMLDIYFKLFSVPIALLTTLVNFLTSPIIAGVAFTGIVITSLLAFIIYIKWLKSPPENLPKCDNKTAEAARGEIEQTFGRNEQLDQAFDVLAAKMEKQREFLLIIGPTGVGKTTFYDEMARRIYKGEVPEEFKDKTLYVGNAADLFSVAGHSGVTPFEKIKIKLRGKHQKEVILCIEELVGLLKGKDQKFADSLKTSLASFPFVVANTTIEEYHQYESKNPAFFARFRKIQLNEMTQEQTLIILRETLQMNSLKMTATDEVLKYIYDESQKHKEILKNQPSASNGVLAQAIIKVKHQFFGETIAAEIRKKREVLDRTKRTLNASSLSGHHIHSDAILKDLSKITELDAEIKKLESDFNKCKTEVSHFNYLNASLVKKQNDLFTLAKLAKKRLDENALKKILLLQYFVTPYLEGKIQRKMEDHQLIIDKELIDNVIAEIVKMKPQEKKDEKDTKPSGAAQL